MNPSVAVHVIVKGRVQGVGYRYFCQAAAVDGTLQGWVRNCPDGTVEAEAQGPLPAVEKWLDALRQGPPLSRVEALQIDWRPCGDYSDFAIR